MGDSSASSGPSRGPSPDAVRGPSRRGSGEAPGAAAGGFARRLREAAGDELAELLAERLGELDEAAVAQLLRNPHAGGEAIAQVASRRDLLTSYVLRREIARHPRTSEALALRLVAGLYWQDLLAIGRDTRLRPVIRRAADRQLASRLAGFSLGEKTAIARRAGRGVVQQLRDDPNPRVIAALLDNPRMTEGILGPLVHRDDARPEVLRVIADNPRWGSRYGLRVALARNPRTPVATAQRLLPMLKKVDLRAVAADPRLPRAVRRRAELLGGG